MKQIIFLVTFIMSAISCLSQTEYLKIVWPEEYKWKICVNHKEEATQLIELIPDNEDSKSWTILGAMMIAKNMKISSTDQYIQAMTKSSLNESPKAKLTILERNDSTKNIWIIFKIETPSFPNDPNPESQLYYAIQGEQSFYIVSMAIKKKYFHLI